MDLDTVPAAKGLGLELAVVEERAAAGHLAVEPRAAAAVPTYGNPVAGEEAEAEQAEEVEAGPVGEVERGLAGEVAAEPVGEVEPAAVAGREVREVVVEEQAAEVAAQVAAPRPEAEVAAEEVQDREAAQWPWVRRGPRPENGRWLRQCCVVARLRGLRVWREQERELDLVVGAADTPSRKKTFVRCWDCSRNWVNREKILNIGWMCRRSNRG